MQKLVFTNGGGQSIDLTSGNFGITNWEGLSGVGLNIQTQQVPFQDGGVFLDALMEQREISVTVAIQDNNDLSARYERKRQLISALNPKLGEGVLVYTNDYLSRQIKAVPQLPIFENKNSNDAGTLKANVTFSCCSPYWEDTEDTVVDINAGEIKEIENVGDISTQIEGSFLGYAQKPKLINRTTNQKIEYNGLINGIIGINTNVGEKKVTQNSFQNDIDITAQSLFRFKKIIYVNSYGKFYAVIDNCRGESEDGINWIIKKLETGPLEDARDLIYVEEKNLFIILLKDSVSLSNDGEEWERIEMPFDYSYNPKQRILYNTTQGVFYVVAEAIILKSLDCRNWESVFSSSKTYISIACKNNLNISIANDGTVAYSTNGTSWTEVSTGLNSGNKIYYSSTLDLFIVAGNNGEIATSSNGTSWTIRTSGTTENLRDIFEDNGKIIIAGYNGIILVSEDGINWTQKNSGTTKTLYTIAKNNYNNEVIIGGQDFIRLKSEDLNNWEVIQGDENKYYSCVYCKYLKTFFTVGTNGAIYKSSDGEKWEQIQNITNADLLSICSNEEKKQLVAVGKSGVILISSDGENWGSINSGINTDLNFVCYNIYLEKYYAVGNGGVVLSSINGESWEAQESGVNTDLYSIAFSEDMMIIISHYTALKSIDGTSYTEYPVRTGGDGNKSIVFHKVLKSFVIAYKDVSSIGLVMITSKDGEEWKSQIVGGNLKTYTITNMIFSESINQIIASYLQTTTYGGMLATSDLYHWTQRSVGLPDTECYGVAEGEEEVIICGDNDLIFKVNIITGENIIRNLSTDSDIGLKLNKGKNRITLLCDNGILSAKIFYRQKYIGV